MQLVSRVRIHYKYCSKLPWSVLLDAMAGDDAGLKKRKFGKNMEWLDKWSAVCGHPLEGQVHDPWWDLPALGLRLCISTFAGWNPSHAGCQPCWRKYLETNKKPNKPAPPLNRKENKGRKISKLELRDVYVCAPISCLRLSALGT